MNVGMVLVNAKNEVFWGRRAAKTNGWQFPQGGVHEDEEPIDAMFRELGEEVGLGRDDVELVAESRGWLTYHLPKNFRRYHSKPLVVGQKQRWYLLRLTGGDFKVRLDATDSPEFNAWRWVDYWYPVDNIIEFKRDVYQSALKEFEPIIFK